VSAHISTSLNDIVYARIRLFSKGVSDALGGHLDKLAPEKTRGIILDFRNNGGGVLNEGLRCAELFVGKGKYLMRTVQHGGKIQNYVSISETPCSLPLVVLVNRNSASASEIVAAALRDEVGAPIVGTQTYGKATIEHIFPLQNGYRVKFTTGAMYSPKGKSWQRHGILPDYPVAQDVDILKRTAKLSASDRLARDSQLRVAHQILTRSER